MHSGSLFKKCREVSQVICLGRVRHPQNALANLEKNLLLHLWKCVLVLLFKIFVFQTPKFREKVSRPPSRASNLEDLQRSVLEIELENAKKISQILLRIPSILDKVTL
ncbi:hypothetical protein GPALN_010660 [Globodera pallida]|nr:hypothetical protein GPALN_010660 [Globodera pallida]